MATTKRGEGRRDSLMLSFRVYGVAAPQGSTKAYIPRGWKRPIITADSARTKPWRQAVVDAALVAIAGAPPIEGPAHVGMTFFLARPKTATRRVVEPAKKPDLDKLTRALLDALTTAGVWRDDAQAVSILARKAFAGGPRDPLGPAGVPRAEIAVTPA